MKKRIIGIICVVIVLAALVFLGLRYGVGQISQVKIKADKSDIYSEEDMGQAEDAVKRFFFLHMRGMTLEELRYEEEAAYPMARELAEEGIAEEAADIIIFHSDFSKKYSYYGNEAYNDQEKGFQWTVIRDSKSGKWKVDKSLSGEG